jgi:uncharacterized membrane protein
MVVRELAHLCGQPEDNTMTRYMMVGLSVLAGIALFEMALIPGMAIGGAAVLAPQYLPKLRRRLRPAFNSMIRRPTEPALPLPGQLDVKGAQTAADGLRIKQAVAKTITFRAIVTTLDFTTNYVVIGELATAAGLSAFALVAGPLFYLAHESAWNYWGPSGTAVELPGLQNPTGQGAFTVNRALAKTITFRTIATAMDFTANYLTVGELATAAGLSAFGFVVGPFVYLGHEMAWDYYGSPRERTRDLATSIEPVPAPTRLGRRQ